MGTTKTPPEGKYAKPRRSARLSFAIPITLTGRDSSGKEFKENTRTVVINKHGASLGTSQQLALGTEVLVENRALSRAAKASVVWLGKKLPGKEQIEIGVELSESQNIWGIEFPPDDWEEDPQIGTGSPGAELEALTLPVKTNEVALLIGTPEPADEHQSPPVAKAIRPRPSSAAPADGSPIRPTSRPQQSNATADAEVVGFRKRLEETQRAALKSFAEKVVKFSKDIGLRVQANLQDVANRLEDRMTGLLEEKVTALADRAQASRGDLDVLLAKLQQFEIDWEHEVQKTQLNIQSASFQALESATEELNEKLRKEADRTLDDARRRLQEENQKQRAEISPIWLQEIHSKAADILVGFSSRLEEIVRTFEQKDTKVVLENLQRSAQDLVASAEGDIQKKAEEAARAFDGVSRRQIETELQKVIDERIEQSAIQLRNLAKMTLEHAAAQLNEKEQLSVNQAVEIFRNRIGAMLSPLQTKNQGTAE